MASIFEMTLAEGSVVKALHGAVRDHCGSTGDTMEDLAAALPKMTATRLTCMLNGHDRMPLWVLISVSRLIRRHDAVQALCATCDGYVVLSPREETRKALTTADALLLLKECTEAVTAIIEGMADGRFTDGEKADALTQISEAMIVLVEVRQLVEECRTVPASAKPLPAARKGRK